MSRAGAAGGGVSVAGWTARGGAAGFRAGAGAGVLGRGAGAGVGAGATRGADVSRVGVGAGDGTASALSWLGMAAVVLAASSLGPQAARSAARPAMRR
jgi:hypothetical protein